MGKSTRARYTLEFRLAAVRTVKGGQSLAATAKIGVEHANAAQLASYCPRIGSPLGGSRDSQKKNGLQF